MMLDRLKDVRITTKDVIDMKQALASDNHMKILVGFTCLDKYFKAKMEWLSTGDKKMLVADELKEQFKEVLNGTCKLMLDALKRDPKPPIEYHELGYNTYLQLVQDMHTYPKVFDEDNKREMFKGLKTLIISKKPDLELRIWQHLV